MVVMSAMLGGSAIPKSIVLTETRKKALQCCKTDYKRLNYTYKGERRIHL